MRFNLGSSITEKCWKNGHCSEGKRKKRLEEKFEAWEEALSDAERKEVINKLPPQLMVLHRAHGISNPEIRNWLFNYYLQQAVVE